MNKVNDLIRQGCRIYKVDNLTNRELRYLSNRLLLNIVYDSDRKLLYVKTKYECE